MLTPKSIRASSGIVGLVVFWILSRHEDGLLASGTLYRSFGSNARLVADGSCFAAAVAVLFTFWLVARWYERRQS
jgi:hypothetical protein